MASDAMPTKQEVLYKQYRQHVEKESEASEEAQAIREQILQRENENSAFLQEMRFMIELRDL